MTRHTSLLTSHDHGHAVEGVVCHWVVRSRHNTQRVLDLRFFYQFVPVFTTGDDQPKAGRWIQRSYCKVDICSCV